MVRMISILIGAGFVWIGHDIAYSEHGGLFKNAHIDPWGGYVITFIGFSMIFYGLFEKPKGS